MAEKETVGEYVDSLIFGKVKRIDDSKFVVRSVRQTTDLERKDEPFSSQDLESAQYMVQAVSQTALPEDGYSAEVTSRSIKEALRADREGRMASRIGR